MASTSGMERWPWMSHLSADISWCLPGPRHAQTRGDFKVVLGPRFVMSEELLQAAMPRVRYLRVEFDLTAVEEEERKTADIQQPSPGGEEPSGEEPPVCEMGWIFQLEHLIGLSFTRYPYKTVPFELGNLHELRKLHMYGSPELECLPRSIGSMSHLQELDCYCSYHLHYLPYEVVYCPRLSDSRFSTRALYHNFKNHMAVPILPSPLEAAAEGLASAIVGAVLLTRLPRSMVKLVLACIEWDRCSVCDSQFMAAAGCHVWAHARIATDDQALLAACCSQTCAATVPGMGRGAQIAYDPVQQKNVTVDKKRSSHWRRLLCAPDILAAALRHNTSLLSDSGSVNHKAPWHSGLWEWTPRAGARDAARQLCDEQYIEEEAEESGDFFVAIRTGDIRSAPSSSATQIGRLEPGDVLMPLESPIVQSRDLDVYQREWLQFMPLGSDRLLEQMAGQDSCWTAMTKKDGTPKLRRVNDFEV